MFYRYIPSVERTTMINKIWDKIGICASGLCLIHCLATPIMLLALPGFEFSPGIDEHFHEIFAVVVVSSIMFAVYPNCRKHGHNDIILIALAGIILILISTFFHQLPIALSHTMTIAGSITLIIAHIKNMKVRHGKCSSNTHNH